MNKTTNLSVILSLLYITMAFYSYGQTSKTDSLQYNATLNKAVSNFYKVINKQSGLYNGVQPQSIDPRIKGNIYLRDTLQYINGSINYDGIVYQDVPLLYDVYRDVVISLLPDGISRYSFLSQRLQYFNMGQHHYVRVDADTAKLKSGFYEELYNNKLRVLSKTEKAVQITTVDQRPESYFSKSTSYYIKKGSTYYSADGEGAIISALKDKKKELKQYLKTNKIKFKQDPEKALVLLATFYDSLTN